MIARTDMAAGQERCGGRPEARSAPGAGRGRQSLLRPLLVAALVAAGLASAAQARPARCSTTDDATFRCDFRTTQRDGSFTISAPGKPTYRLNIVEPGVASGFVTLGGRNVALPGLYRRDARPATGCWVNDVTKARLCAK